MRPSVAFLALLLKLTSSEVEVERNFGFSPGYQMMQYCADQVGTIQFNATRYLRGDSGAAPSCGCVQYKVCINLVKRQGTISGTCVKPSNTCNLPDGFDGTTGQNLINPISQCQYGQAGDTLYFMTKDSDTCVPDPVNFQDYASKLLTVPNVDGSSTNILAECRSFPAWLDNGVTLSSCFGNGDKACGWRVELPGPDNEALCDARVSAKDIEWPSPGASQSPPECKCAPENKDCAGEINDLVQKEGYLHTTILDCTDPEQIAKDINAAGRAEGREYGCERSLIENCNTILCTSFVPAKDYPTHSHQCPLTEVWY